MLSPEVSIPLRKVSRRRCSQLQFLIVSGFHPSKEGFKARRAPASLPWPASFHPSKEGFKVRPVVASNLPCLRFHPSKEGFKVFKINIDVLYLLIVSIPLRKVSR